MSCPIIKKVDEAGQISLFKPIVHQNEWSHEKNILDTDLLSYFTYYQQRYFYMFSVPFAKFSGTFKVLGVLLFYHWFSLIQSARLLFVSTEQ